MTEAKHATESIEYVFGPGLCWSQKSFSSHVLHSSPKSGGMSTWSVLPGEMSEGNVTVGKNSQRALGGHE